MELHVFTNRNGLRASSQSFLQLQSAFCHQGFGSHGQSSHTHSMSSKDGHNQWIHSNIDLCKPLSWSHHDLNITSMAVSHTDPCTCHLCHSWADLRRTYGLSTRLSYDGASCHKTCNLYFDIGSLPWKVLFPLESFWMSLAHLCPCCFSFSTFSIFFLITTN